jgi:hypothetical protein
VWIRVSPFFLFSCKVLQPILQVLLQLNNPSNKNNIHQTFYSWNN